MKNLCIQVLSIARLRHFCINHRISGYKNKEMAVTCTMYDPNQNSDNKGDDSDVDCIARMVVREVSKCKKKNSK